MSIAPCELGFMSGLKPMRTNVIEEDLSGKGIDVNAFDLIVIY
jgi:hypothetical protein